MHQPIDLEQLCAERGLRITEQRRVIARVLAAAEDHPDVEELYRRCSAVDPSTSLTRLSVIGPDRWKPPPFARIPVTVTGNSM